MKSDLYIKIVLSIIAACLFFIAADAETIISIAHTHSHSTYCSGELKAKAYGGTETSIGGYDVDITCR